VPQLKHTRADSKPNPKKIKKTLGKSRWFSHTACLRFHEDSDGKKEKTQYDEKQKPTCVRGLAEIYHACCSHGRSHAGGSQQAGAAQS
jgi:hypothetical protein